MSEADLRELRVCASPELRIGRVYRPVYSGLVHTGITAILGLLPLTGKRSYGLGGPLRRALFMASTSAHWPGPIGYKVLPSRWCPRWGGTLVRLAGFSPFLRAAFLDRQQYRWQPGRLSTGRAFRFSTSQQRRGPTLKSPRRRPLDSCRHRCRRRAHSALRRSPRYSSQVTAGLLGQLTSTSKPTAKAKAKPVTKAKKAAAAAK
ncbi:hypothetical protein AWB68_08293 [Caballeronia choica]|uniref:Uncharacterized protein n=1 Tax=Caballeronia choica TaxID=326476 RepID=A0A158L188_9BURK|nr:hypothetical protein AWB68_08293 [Caballeronia choica]